MDKDWGALSYSWKAPHFLLLDFFESLMQLVDFATMYSTLQHCTISSLFHGSYIVTLCVCTFPLSGQWPRERLPASPLLSENRKVFLLIVGHYIYYLFVSLLLFS